MNEKNEFATIQKIGEDLMIVIPGDICEKLDITNGNMLFKEGSKVIIDSFICGEDTGIRIRPKN